MNKTKLLVVMSLMMAQFSWAQRTIDMEATLEAPLHGSTWLNGAEIPITFKIVNHGPDNLVAGDSLFFLPNISGFGIQMVILGQAVNNGTSIIVFDQALSIQAPSTPFNADLCVTVLDPNAVGLSIAGMPITVSYSDPDTSNNTTCSNITFVSDTSGTSIVDVDGANELLMVYPNPATDKVSFSFHLFQASGVQVAVADMTGRVVKM